MEVCGGQTHAILRFGLDRLLPETIELLHGPGCPVCVTPAGVIDQAIALAGRQGLILTTFGDMLRVPGTATDLLHAKAAGGDVRMVYSPLDALALARENPDREVVFFGVGFETTAPANALAVFRAKREGVRNFSLLSSHVLVPPAMAALLSSPGNRVRGFLAAGHVCAIAGTEEYEPLAEQFQVPIVVTGFEPIDILHGILETVLQLESGSARVENAYARVVRREGNPPAREMVARIFRLADREWRGLGVIPMSGLEIAEAYRDFDAAFRFDLPAARVAPDSECVSGRILRGEIKPPACPAFGTRCTPEHPLGATMVSSEGACAAYYRYRHVP